MSKQETQRLAKAVEDLLRYDSREGIVDLPTDEGWVKSPELAGILDRLRAALPNAAMSHERSELAP